MSRPIETSIEAALRGAFAPAELRVTNESGQHAGPPGRESHFRVLVVSAAFEGRPLVARHRAVHQALKAQLDAGLHALAIEALTPAQWAERAGVAAESPPCGKG